MTAQIADCCKYKGGKYKIVALSESIGFSPIEYGLKPQGVMTSCWRGYWCKYVIERKQLKLDSLHIHTQNDVYPDFYGKTVVPETRGMFTKFGEDFYKLKGNLDEEFNSTD